MDRIELGTQSLKEYRGFAEENEAVQATENTSVLVGKLKSGNPSDTLIVTSIQKMSNIRDEGDYGLNAADLARIQSRRALFSLWMNATAPRSAICCEPSRRRFPGHVLWVYRDADSRRKSEKQSTTSTIFGDELHRYSIADGYGTKMCLDLIHIK